ncbi:MAG: hypothetical protein AAF986_03110 [Pseudomonadota bacterium]
MTHPPLPEEEKSLWEKSFTIQIIWIVLILGCAASAGWGFWLAAEGELGHDPHFEGRAGVFGILGGLADHFPAFYGLVGFVSFSFIVLVGQHLRKILMRPEAYYDGEEGQS